MKKLLLISLLVVASCGDPDPNVACRDHRGVEKVYQTGNNVNGIVCRDGVYVPGGSFN